MTERPILFSAPMVRAILGGLKTQTRRIVKPQPSAEAKDAGCVQSDDPASNGLWTWLDSDQIDWASPIGDWFRSPYGVPGDRIWVRETMKRREGRQWVYAADGAEVTLFESDPQVPAMIAWAAHKQGDTCVSIHMPRWASRILLEVVDVRIERLTTCSAADAEAEGVREPSLGDLVETGLGGVPRDRCGAVAAYAALWNLINGDGAWSADPWVWVITFKRVQP